MTIDQLFFTFTAALVVFSCWTLVKSYIDKKDTDLRRHIEGVERWLTDDLRDHRIEMQAKFKDLDGIVKDCYPTHNKAMSKNYYNSQNDKCCKEKGFIQD